MADLFFRGINIVPILWIITIVLFPIQLIFCFKVKSRIVRLLPIIILSILLTVDSIACLVAPGFEMIFFFGCAIYLAKMLFVCGIAWGIWFFIKCIRGIYKRI